MHFSAQIKTLKEQMQNTAELDHLTGVYNRRYIDENIESLIKTISRADGCLTFMMVDLDLFKKFNEKYGHTKGDSCLKNVAKVLAQSVKRDNDIVARYGGEEFLVILPFTDENGSRVIAERLLKNVKSFNIPFFESDVADRVTISIGVVTGGHNVKLTGDDFINKAAEALVVSKMNGRDRYTHLMLT